MQAEYLKQAEEDLLFTIRKIAQEKKLKTQEVAELERKAQIFLNKMRSQKLGWEATDYFNDYEKEFGSSLVRRTLERHLAKIVPKIGRGKYSF